MTSKTEYDYGFAIPRPSMGIPNDMWDRSVEFMAEDLAKSGLTAQDMMAYPCMLGLARHADAGYIIPYFGLDGKPLADKNTGITGKQHRKRFHYPDTVPRDEKGNCPRYKGASIEEVGGLMATAPYVHPSWWNGGKVRYICEGEKKAVALHKRFGVGVMAIAGCGLWSYTPAGGTRDLHPWFFHLMVGVERVVIIPDGDVRRPNISREYRGLTRALGNLGVTAELVNFSLFNPGKIDDWLMANPSVNGLEALEAWERFDVNHMTEDRRHLVREYNLHTEGQHETIVCNESNFVKLLEGYPVFKGQIRYNLDKHKVEYTAMPPEYSMEIETLCYFQDIFGLTKARAATVKNALASVAMRNAYSPLADWLNDLVWDGEVRLDQWMVDYLGADDSEYTREIGRKSLVAAVARRLQPGCPVDYMTILKGGQGIGKSGAIGMLFGRKNTLEYMRGVAEGKDALQQNAHIWCHSDEELGNLTNSDRNKLKAQITIRSDTFRAPYDPAEKEHPRRYVMWGSTNDMSFLPDDVSGQRRYAVVEMDGPVDWVGLAEVREQLWAEAVALFRKGEVKYWQIDGASEHSQRYVLENPLVEQCEDALGRFFNEGAGRQQVLSYKGVEHHWFKLTQLYALLGQHGTVTTAFGHQLGNALRKEGWENKDQLRYNGERMRKVWIRKVNPNDELIEVLGGVQPVPVGKR